MTGACLLRVREANRSSLKVGTCKGEAKSRKPELHGGGLNPSLQKKQRDGSRPEGCDPKGGGTSRREAPAWDQKSRRRESWPARLPLFSANWTLWTTPNEDEMTLVGGAAKFG
jgi:hypothetical protein